MKTLVNLPGIGGSGEKHWHSIWEQSDPSIVRFKPKDWNAPDLQDWIEAVEREVLSAQGQVVLVAHSLSCLLVAHWAAQSGASIAGAFLVSVPDPSGPKFPDAATKAGFQNVPTVPLRFPSLIVASSNDPYGSVEYTRHRASQWKSPMLVLGQLGHINGSSGLEEWKQGQLLLDAFCAGLNLK